MNGEVNLKAVEKIVMQMIESLERERRTDRWPIPCLFYNDGGIS